MRKDEEFARKLQSEAEQQWMQAQEEKYKRLQQQEEERLAAENKRKEDEASTSKAGGILLIPADVSGVVPAPADASTSVPTPAPRSAAAGGADLSVSPAPSMPSVPDRELKKYLNISEQRYEAMGTSWTSCWFAGGWVDELVGWHCHE